MARHFSQKEKNQQNKKKIKENKTLFKAREAPTFQDHGVKETHGKGKRDLIWSKKRPTRGASRPWPDTFQEFSLVEYAGVKQVSFAP
jgi:hypothetical protein